MKPLQNLENEQVAVKERSVPVCKEFKQKGDVVWCMSCPNRHTIPGTELTREGTLAKKRK